MTREEAKQLLPIIQAYAEGKTIEVKIGGYWNDLVDGPNLLCNAYECRVKPEPKYRPFETQEECLEEMHKHSDFGWVKYKDSKSMYHIRVIGRGYILIDGADLLFFEAFDKCEFFDGTPFGIKEE